MKERFLQTQQVAFTEAGALSKTIRLSDAYDRCIGIAVTTSKTTPDLIVSIADSTKTYVQAAPVQLLESSTAVPVADRFLNMSLPARGTEVQMNFQVPASLQGERLAVTFLLERG